MSNGNELQDYFDEYFYDLDEETIIQLAARNNDPIINNVIVGLHNQCYGLMLMDDEQMIDYQLFYVDGKKGLKGHLLKMQLQHQKRDELLFAFSNFIAEAYALDSITVFNTFQDKVRTMAEQIGFLSVDTAELSREMDGANPVIAAKGVRGMVCTPMLRHLDMYEMIFGALKPVVPTQDENFIYLMFNAQSKLIKIGKSRTPGYREKTLQGEEPQISMVAVWKAADQIEKLLHLKYQDKRTRGEWFNLSFQDIKEIKAFMENIPST